MQAQFALSVFVSTCVVQNLDPLVMEHASGEEATFYHLDCLDLIIDWGQ